MAIIGPGAVQEEQADIKPALEGASEYEYITILNPLTDDFAVRVAQDVPINMPVEIRAKTGLVQNEGDVTRAYGLNLKNPDHQARKHITNDMVIRAGQTINLKGDQAQVAVRQLVNEILQREGKGRLLADPTLRREVEERIIKSRGSVQDLMDDRLRSPQTQINDAIKQSNEVTNETAFPELSQADQSGGTEANAPEVKRPSQPKRVAKAKKANS